MTGGITAALSEGQTSVTTSASNVSIAGSLSANGTSTSWHTAGMNLAIGLANGIAYMAGSVRTAAVNAAAGAVRAIQITWSVHSPSQVAEGLAMNFDRGLSGGFDKGAGGVIRSAVSVASSVVDSARTMLRGVNSSLFDGIDPNPTIRPVIDLSDVRNSVGQIDGMFQSERLIASGLFRGVSFSRNASAIRFDGGKITGGQDNRDVVEEIRTLNARIDEMNQAIGSMRLVLDSGALVGGIDQKMDRQLGVLAGRRERGN